MAAGITTDDQDKLANALLMLIEDLVTELRADRTPSFVLSLDSSLDDDLGLDSLARVELISRIEKHFNVSLPQRDFAEAESPRDLLRSITNARGHKKTYTGRKVIERATGLENFPTMRRPWSRCWNGTCSIIRSACTSTFWEMTATRRA